MGGSIINNEYVDAVMVLIGNGKSISTGINIRIRGNTSTYSDKKPYKIKLDDAIDLINGSGNCADTEWILLASAGTNLKTYLGGYIGVQCGMKWQPRMMFVNVMLNGDWKGCYMLIESVKRSKVRVDISKNGYIFENDAYWWNSDGLYFKTTRQIEQLGFTFKYPDITSSTDTKVIRLQNYMQKAEDRITEHDSLTWDYLDVNSWVAWVMGRDVMGQGDGGGSNMYYYIYDLSSENPEDRKIRMGPLWDFDAAYASQSAWSSQHRAEYLYFAYLMDTPEFRMAYESKWNDLSQHLLGDITSYLDKLYRTQGAGLEQSRKLDFARWQTEGAALSQEIEVTKDFFSEQIAWMDKQISEGLE